MDVGKQFGSLDANQKTVVSFAGLVFFILSAVTSFGFFVNAMPGLIQIPVYIDPVTILVITGLVGVFLLDGGVVIWLYILLNAAMNAKQRNIASRAFWVSLAGSIAASFTYIFLFANNLWEVGADARSIIGLIALVGVAFVTSMHFYSIIEFGKHGEVNRLKVRDAKRQDKAEKAEDVALNHVDDLIVQQVQEKMDAVAPQLANTIAERIIRTRLKLDLSSSFMPNNDFEMGGGNPVVGFPMSDFDDSPVPAMGAADQPSGLGFNPSNASAMDTRVREILSKLTPEERAELSSQLFNE